jgi:2-dehydro-3-deoxyphosphogluconate aldolase/(4S)-4-hydroxy-2-oxoglutarate aldolase
MIEWNEKVVPVATLHNQEETEEILSCLQESGLKVVEITYRTDYARNAIEYAVKNYPEILVGAGTVINRKQCKDAIKAGAKFIVGPGFSKEVAKVCKRANILYIPGVVTPSEVQQAVNCGLRILKFFPFSTFGGLSTVNALAGPFPNVKFMLTNGITGDNLSELLKNPHVIGVGGSWMLKGSREEKLEKMKKVVERE